MTDLDKAANITEIMFNTQRTDHQAHILKFEKIGQFFSILQLIRKANA